MHYHSATQTGRSFHQDSHQATEFGRKRLFGLFSQALRLFSSIWGWSLNLPRNPLQVHPKKMRWKFYWTLLYIKTPLSTFWGFCRRVALLLFVTAETFLVDFNDKLSFCLEFKWWEMALKKCREEGKGKGEGLGVDMMNIKRLGLCEKYYVFHRLPSTTHFRKLVY